MDERLRDLQLAMAAHRRALTERSGPAATGSTAACSGGERRRILQRLALQIERVSGIDLTGVIAAKLDRVLSSVDLTELAGWVSRLDQLPADHPEWLSLLESLTVHETFFHRDRAQLDLLGQILRELVAEAAGAGRYALRLWSAGCATGEEAYTLAIVALLALRDAGFAADKAGGGIVLRPPWKLDVLGTDLSRLVLTQAGAAIYSTEGLSAFRDLPDALQRFFPVLPGTNGAVEVRGVVPAVRRHVAFRQFNLLTEHPPDTGFDVVLCRNVLIYLTPEARVAAQKVLCGGLRVGGYLLLGPTDAAADPAAYRPRWGSGAVAYKRVRSDE